MLEIFYYQTQTTLIINQLFQRCLNSLYYFIMRRIFNSISKLREERGDKSPSKKSLHQSNQKRLNTLISRLFDCKDNQNDLNIAQSLSSLAELLVWAQKHNNKLFWQIDEMNLFDDLYLTFFQKDRLGVLQSLILMITNMKTDYWIQKVLVSPIMNRILNQKFNQQQSTYLVNLLKCIGQKITISNAPILVNSDRSLFLERCAQFINHQQDMMRTSSLNIILNIMNLKSEALQNIFGQMPFAKFYFDLCKRLGEKLSRFDTLILQASMNNYHLNKQISELDDILIFFEDLAGVSCVIAQNMISKTFYHDVVLGMILQSLTMQGNPPLSMKVGVFALIKIFPILVKMGIHNEVLESLLSLHEVEARCWYSTNMSDSEKLNKFVMLIKNQLPPDEPKIIKSLRQNITILLTCKDDNLLYLLTYLVIQIFKCKQFDEATLIRCGIYFDSDNTETSSSRTLFLDILMKQFRPPFRVLTIKNIAILILRLSQLIDKSSYIMHNNQILLFQTMYKQSIKQIRSSLGDASIYKALEYFQNDSKYIQIKGLEVKQKVGKQAFMIPGEENTNLGFYERCPITPSECIRLDLFIFGMLRKIRYIMFPSKTISYQDSAFSRIYFPQVSVQQNFKQGQLCKTQDKTLKCKIFSKSIWIYCILDDRTNFILVAEQHVASRIILNLKFKYLSFQSQSKNQGFSITVKVKNYSASSQDFVNKDDIKLKGENLIMSQWICAQLQARKRESLQSEIKFVDQFLSKSEDDATLIAQK